MLKETLIPYTPGGPRTKKLFDFEEVAHTYKYNGKFYTSVSKVIEGAKEKFDKDNISAAVARKQGRTQEDVIEQWDLNNSIATNYGTAVHNAIEYWIKFGLIPKQRYLAEVVGHFKLIIPGRDGLLSEVVLHNQSKLIAGTTDILHFQADDTVTILDLKTNYELTEDKLNHYALQLNLYRSFVELCGYKVDGMDIFHWDGSRFNVIHIGEVDVEYILSSWNHEEIAAPLSKKSFTTDENIRFGQAYNLAFDYYSKAKNLDLQKVGDMAIEIYHNISQTKEQLN